MCLQCFGRDRSILLLLTRGSDHVYTISTIICVSALRFFVFVSFRVGAWRCGFTFSSILLILADFTVVFCHEITAFDVARPCCIILLLLRFCLMQRGDVHALLCATGTRGVPVDAEVFQQRHGGVLGTRTAGGSGARFCQGFSLMWLFGLAAGTAATA